MLFVEENTTEGERKLFRKKGKSDSEIYSIIYERIRPKMEAEIAEKEADLDKMLDSFLTLSPALRERANEKMEAIQAEINARKLELIDLGKLWGNLHEELIARKAAISKAAKSLAKDGAGRRKTEALSEVIDKIVCWFRYTDKEGKPTKKKSRLDKVEIVSVSGDTFRVISSPGPC
jgi:C4-dicarboxylate-specific signal transduction histidine kinase